MATERAGAGETNGPVGATLGRYRIEALLGRGGTAAVYRAADPASGRRVAIKVLYPALAHHPQFVDRFLREARAITRLHHPNIVSVHDVGERGSTAFFVMEYVEGGTFRDRLRHWAKTGGETPVTAAIALLRPVASALDYAHRQGVIHRDVKPKNILLTADGRPLLADFGIAKALGRGDSTTNTPDMIVGTVEYMSPEQGQGLALDGRADLYSLGVILYEALTGRHPFRVETPNRVPGSVTVRYGAAPPAPHLLNPVLGSAVGAVLLRALDKHPENRYPTGAALFAALDEALVGWRASAAASPVTAIDRLQITRPLERAQQEYLAFTQQVKWTPPQPPVGPAPEPPVELAPVGPAPEPPVDVLLAASPADVHPAAAVRGVVEGGEAERAPEVADGAPLGPSPAPVVLQLRPPAVAEADGLFASGSLRPLTNRYPKLSRGYSLPNLLRIVSAALLALLLSVGLLAAAFSARDARRGAPAATTGVNAPLAATTPGAGTVDPATGATAPTLAPVLETAVAPVATARAAAAPTVTPAPPAARVPLGGQPAVLVGHTNTVSSFAWSPDGGRVVASSADDGTVRLWTADGKAVAMLSGHTLPAQNVVWSPDGRHLASSSYDGTARLWTAEGNAVATLAGHTDQLTTVAWSPDGRYLATASADDTVRLWTADGRAHAVLAGHTDNVESLAWSPNGTAVASGGKDNTVRLWGADGRPQGVLGGHTGPVVGVAWSPDGRTLASGANDGTVRLWSADGKTIATLAGHTDQVTKVAWSPDGKSLASASRDTTARIWAADGQARATLRGHTDRVYSLAWSPDSSTLATGAKDATVRLWDVEGAPLEVLTGHTSTVWALAWSPDGKTLASGGDDSTIRLWR